MGNSALNLQSPIGVQDNRNELINGDFNIWQRGTTVDIRATDTGYGIAGRSAGGATQGNKFGADRWRIYLDAKTNGVTAPAMTISRNKMPLGFPSGADRASRWYLNIFVGMTGATAGTNNAHEMGGFTGAGHTNDGSFAALVQDIDDVQTLEGKTCTLSFWAKSDITNQRVAPVLKQCFAGGTAATLLVKGSTGNLGFTLDNTWRQYKTSFNVPSVEGQPLADGDFEFGSSGDDALQLQLVLHSNGVHGATMELGGGAAGPNDGRTGNISFSQIQLEQGSKTTEFDKTNPMTEVALCQRYYQKTYDLDVTPNTETHNGSHSFETSVHNSVTWSNHFITTMRSTPVCVFYDRYGTGENTVNQGNGTRYGPNASYLFVSGECQTGFLLHCTDMDEMDMPRQQYYYWHYTADAELSVDTD